MSEPMTSAERQRRHRATRPYGPTRADYRYRFGTYEREPCCELLLESCLGTEELQVHHAYYQTCPDCRGDRAGGGDGRRGHCKLPEHLVTVCRPCHRETHRGEEGIPDYRMEAALAALWASVEEK